MKANPGGQLAPEDVIGRDEMIVQLWHALEQQSVVLTAERRLGKTQLIKKICATPLEGKLMRYRDLERIETLEDLAKLLIDDFGSLIGFGTRAKTKSFELLQSLSGTKIEHIGTLPQLPGPQWPKVIHAVLQDLAALDQQIILFWDEFPWMVQEIIKRDGALAASDLLDLLRAIRQESNTLRFVITGSIGLRHVLDDLKEKAGYRNAAFNDMHLMEVPPLSEAHAVQLAQKLLNGEGFLSAEDNDSADTIARAAGNVPYYIHQLVKGLVVSRVAANEANIQTLVSEALTAANDPWNLKYFYDRIEDYYGETNTPIVRGLLDIFAIRDESISIADAHTLVQANGLLARDAVLEYLDKLTSDHYLTRELDGRYRFRYPLIARWWRLYRGL